MFMGQRRAEKLSQAFNAFDGIRCNAIQVPPSGKGTSVVRPLRQARHRSHLLFVGRAVRVSHFRASSEGPRRCCGGWQDSRLILLPRAAREHW